MQTGRRLPRAISHSGHEFTLYAGGRSGTMRPLHKTTKRESVMPVTFTCIRSTDESTLRTV